MRFLVPVIAFVLFAQACNADDSAEFARATATADSKAKTAEALQLKAAEATYNEIVRVRSNSAEVMGALVLLKADAAAGRDPSPVTEEGFTRMVAICASWDPYPATELWPPEYKTILSPTTLTCTAINTYTKADPDGNDSKALGQTLALIFKAGWDKQLTDAHKAIPDRSKAQVLRAIAARQ